MTSSLPPEIPSEPPAIPPVRNTQGAQPPTRKSNWPKVVGIIGIIFGAIGLLGGAQLMMMPTMMETQKNMMADMQRMSESSYGNRRNSAPPPKELFGMFDKMFDMPEWFPVWSKIGGILAMAISGFYIFGAIRLLKLKPDGPSLFCWAAGLAISLAIVRIVVGVSVGSLMSFGLVLNAVFGGVADGVLCSITASGDKSMFKEKT